MDFEYLPRNDFVIIRRQKRAIVRGLLMPEQSAEGVDFFVYAVGPDVKDIKPGDQVMIMGQMGKDEMYPVPGEPQLVVVQQRVITYTIRKLPDA